MKAYTIGLYEKAMPGDLSYKEKLMAAKEAGYDYMELSIDATDEKIARVDMSKEERLDLILDMHETGIPIRSMCVSALTKYAIGDSDEKICQKGLQILEKSIQLADDLGVRIIMIPGYDIYYGESTPDTQQRFLLNLKNGTQLAASRGILLGLETMENSFMNTVWKAMYYVKMIESPYLGVYPDTGNIKNAAFEAGTQETQDLCSGKGHISAIHLKESKPGVFREVPYGTGHVDFEKIIRAAWEIGVRKFVTEFWYVDNSDWKCDLQEANSRMRKIIDKNINVLQGEAGFDIIA